MSPALRRVLAALPPLLVAGGLAWVLLHARPAAELAREREEAAIRARWSARSESVPLRAEVKAYLERYGASPAARWFAVEAYARVQDARAAYETWAALRGPASEASAHRFARTLMDGLSRPIGEADHVTILFPRCAQARLESGDETAAADLRWLVERIDPAGVLPVCAPMRHSPSRASRVMGSLLLAHDGDPVFEAAGAVLLTGPQDRTQVPRLLEWLGSAWRSQQPFLWQDVARALGASGSPEALKALRDVRATATGDDPVSKGARWGAEAGLAVAGDADAEARLLAAADDPMVAWAGQLLALGLCVRLAQGDATAAAPLVRLWDRFTVPAVRLTVGTACLLADPAPPPAVPGDAWAEALTHGSTRVARVVGQAWRLRRGAAGAFSALEEELGASLRAEDLASSADAYGDETAAAMEVLRAWVRWR